MRATGQHVAYNCPHPGCTDAVEVHGTVVPGGLGVPTHAEAEFVVLCAEDHELTDEQHRTLRERFEGGDALDWAGER